MNTNLRIAKRSKNDEFYTQYVDIEKELRNYDVSIFKDKVIYLPTDVASFDATIPQSEFVRYFLTNAERFGYKRLIATCLDKFTPNGLNGYEYNNTDDDSVRERHFKCLPDADGSYGSGDFRSQECVNILKKSDIVVTNPPFSLFREFMAWFEPYLDTKKLIVIGNQNAITYKEFFPLIRDNKIRIGSQTGCKAMSFVDAQNDGYKEFGNICWFTNADIAKHHEKMLLTERYYSFDGVTPLPKSESIYPKYDNYDAINIDKLKLIPKDYYGVMGVPITFLYKYNPEQFEIIGFFNNYNPETADPSIGQIIGKAVHVTSTSSLFRGPVVDGKAKYFRILIKRKVGD